MSYNNQLGAFATTALLTITSGVVLVDTREVRAFALPGKTLLQLPVDESFTANEISEIQRSLIESRTNG
jgi:hypothetical protein